MSESSRVDILQQLRVLQEGIAALAQQVNTLVAQIGGEDEWAEEQARRLLLDVRNKQRRAK